MTPKHTLEDVRDALFAALAETRDKSQPLDVQRHRTTCDIAARISETARLEIDYMRATNCQQGSGFIPISGATDGTPEGQPIQITQTTHGVLTEQKVPGGKIIAHRMR